MQQFTHTISQKRELASSNTLSYGYQAILISLGVCILTAIILIKSRTATDIIGDPLLFGYAFFVTLFQMSRLVSSLFYKKSYAAAVEPYAAAIDYEPKISFIIPCKNEEAAIGNTIQKCFDSDYPKHKVEVIAINDGSTDNTLDEMIKVKKKNPSLIIVNWKQNKGKRYGMAEGFRRSTGEIVIQLDSDSYVDPTTIRELIKPFANPEVGAISAHTDPSNADENTLTKMQTAYYFMSFRLLKAAESTFHTVFCCSGCASAYRKSAVMSGLDTWLNETFLGLPVTWGDDRAITNWVLRNGYKTLYSDTTKAFTVVPTQFKQFLRQQIRWKKGWFVNSMFASKFIIARDPFVAFTYFFPLIFVTLLTPFMAVRAFVFTPIMAGPEAILFYMVGVLLMAFLIVIFYRMVAPDNKYWPYLFLWAIINMIFLSCLLFYALATIQNRKWGTR